MKQNNQSSNSLSHAELAEQEIHSNHSKSQSQDKGGLFKMPPYKPQLIDHPCRIKFNPQDMKISQYVNQRYKAKSKLQKHIKTQANNRINFFPTTPKNMMMMKSRNPKISYDGHWNELIKRETRTIGHRKQSDFKKQGQHQSIFRMKVEPQELNKKKGSYSIGINPLWNYSYQKSRNQYQKDISKILLGDRLGRSKSQSKQVDSRNASKKRLENKIVEQGTKQNENFDFFELSIAFDRTDYSQVEDIKNVEIKAIPEIPPKMTVELFVTNYQPLNEEIDMKELMKSNFFRIQYTPESFYFGEMVSKLKSGLGILLTKNNLFEGLWRNGKRVRGVEVNTYGRYKGNFCEDLRSGRGQFTWNNGQYYIGDWKKGKRNGMGFWKNKAGDRYNGIWKNGKREGKGVLIQNQYKYKGQFMQSLKHGWGKEFLPNGDVFVGMYREGMPNGKGTYKWQNGSQYEGQFLGGQRNGYGIMKSPHNLIYMGDFKSDKMVGQCQMFMPNGDYYKGGFKFNRKHGRGTLIIDKEKVTLRGLWKDDFFLEDQIY